MKKKDAAHKKRNSAVRFFFFCCCVCLLSGCSSLSSSAPSSASPPASNSSSAKVVSVATKVALGPTELKAQSLLNKMSLSDKIAQMILVMYNGSDYASSDLQQMVAQQHVGGVLYQGYNYNFNSPVDTITAVNAFSAQIVSDDPTAPLIAIDEEGGDVDKISR